MLFCRYFELTFICSFVQLDDVIVLADADLFLVTIRRNILLMQKIVTMDFYLKKHCRNSIETNSRRWAGLSLRCWSVPQGFGLESKTKSHRI